MHLHRILVEFFLKSNEQRMCMSKSQKPQWGILRLGRMWVTKEQNGRNYKKYPQTHILHRILLFRRLQANLAYIAHPWFIPKVNLFLKLNQVFLCIISYGRGMDQQLITDQLNTRALTSSKTPLAHALTMCGIVHGNSLKTTIMVIQKRLTSMCRLEIHMDMKNHVLLRQQHQGVIIMSNWRSINCKICCTMFGFVIRRYSLYPFLLVTNPHGNHRCIH